MAVLIILSACVLYLLYRSVSKNNNAELIEKLRNSKTVRGKTTFAIFQKGFGLEQSISIYLTNKDAVDIMLSEGSSYEEIADQLTAHLEQPKQGVVSTTNNSSSNLLELLKQNPALTYFIVATIVIIIIAVTNDGSAPYTGGNDSDYIWRPSKR